MRAMTSSPNEMHADNLQRVAVKLFLENRDLADFRAFVPIFHSWIQKKALLDHLLIDVHDYSHIHNGPGILLVSHEANISIDRGEGRPGLLYQRKQPIEGSLPERVRIVLQHALQACSILEQEAGMEGKLKFGRTEVLVITNDRLNAPNDSQTFETLQNAIAAACEPVFGRVSLTPVNADPKERLAVLARRQ
jgi:hypothetical protein